MLSGPKRRQSEGGDIVIKADFKKRSFGNILCQIYGLFLIGLFIFVGYKGGGSAKGGIVAGIFSGVVVCIFIVIQFFNFRACLYVEDGRIKGHYSYFGKIDCDLSDVDFVLPQINTVTILLKNGKRYTIGGVENPWEFSSAVRRQIFMLESETPDDVRYKLEAVQADRKKEIFYVIGGTVLMFLNILFAMLLTGGRETYEFSKLDWGVFIAAMLIEMLTLIMTFYYADKSGRRLLVIEHLKHRLKGAIIASQPLPPGNLIRVYTDENYTGRIVVFYIPHDEGFYYCIQNFSGNEFRLDTGHTSEIYQSEEIIAEEAHALIDITEHFQ